MRCHLWVEGGREACVCAQDTYCCAQTKHVLNIMYAQNHRASNMHKTTCARVSSLTPAGNLLKMRDGRLAYLDFGMMGQIDVDVSVLCGFENGMHAHMHA